MGGQGQGQNPGGQNANPIPNPNANNANIAGNNWGGLSNIQVFDVNLQPPQ
jgi:hypothetical protein